MFTIASIETLLPGLYTGAGVFYTSPAGGLQALAFYLAFRGTIPSRKSAKHPLSSIRTSSKKLTPPGLPWYNEKYFGFLQYQLKATADRVGLFITARGSTYKDPLFFWSTIVYFAGFPSSPGACRRPSPPLRYFIVSYIILRFF